MAASFRSPYHWSPGKKAIIVAISCLTTIFASFASSAYAPCKDQLMGKWQLPAVTVLAGIPVFTAGFALGPMVLAPLSEIKGRKPVFVSTGILFIICTIGFIVNPTTSPTPTVKLGMRVFSADHAAFWIQVIANGMLITAFVLVVPETRESVWLARKAKFLNEWYQQLQKSQPTLVELIPRDGSQRIRTRHVQWYVAGESSAEDLLGLITGSLVRPFQLLLTEPVVFFFSAWAAFSWSVLYITLAAVPTMFMEVYGFSLSRADATFTSACVGSILATVVGIYQERHISLFSFKSSDDGSPEKRLYFSCIESLLLPIGLFMFGWSATVTCHWIVPTMAIGIATAGIFSVYLAASSALAAQSFCRNAIGGVLPLVTNQMYSSLGHGPGSSMLGGIGLLLSVGPWVLVFYGPQIRSRSRIARLLDNKA
ncbi:major facilitator superfamily domain-containing protein [Thelonectria olida]|uniref:Major facilitator superfamily domain-containing protein n=1 Tax=Thelonectria olida TaxID=1576542 RepID=A0A9P8WBS0_9HYPO|nr:major facilitator superfamily domain-containing protein [Thelonectria olida]